MGADEVESGGGGRSEEQRQLRAPVVLCGTTCCRPLTAHRLPDARDVRALDHATAQAYDAQRPALVDVPADRVGNRQQRGQDRGEGDERALTCPGAGGPRLRGRGPRGRRFRSLDW
jgi:hypothetical protein